MRKLIILVFVLMLVVPIVAESPPLVIQTSDGDLKFKTFELLPSQIVAYELLNEKYERELLKLLEICLKDLRLVYKDMPEEVTWNPNVGAFQGEVKKEDGQRSN